MLRFFIKPKGNARVKYKFKKDLDSKLFPIKLLKLVYNNTT